MSTRLRLVWNARARLASGRMWTSPEYTERASSSTAPLNSRSLRVFGRGVVLERAEVEHLRAVAEVDGEQVALGALPVEAGLAAESGVVAAERDRGRPQAGVASEVRALERDLPRVRAVLLHRQVADVRAVADEQLDDRVDEVVARRRRAEPVDDRDLGALVRDDQRVREGGEPVALRPVQDDDRPVDHDARGHVHERAAGEEGVVQHA